MITSLLQTWVEAVGPAMVEKYSKEEIKRQEACNIQCTVPNFQWARELGPAP